MKIINRLKWKINAIISFWFRSDELINDPYIKVESIFAQMGFHRFYLKSEYEQNCFFRNYFRNNKNPIPWIHNQLPNAYLSFNRSLYKYKSGNFHISFVGDYIYFVSEDSIGKKPIYELTTKSDITNWLLTIDCKSLLKIHRNSKLEDLITHH